MKLVEIKNKVNKRKKVRQFSELIPVLNACERTCKSLSPYVHNVSLSLKKLKMKIECSFTVSTHKDA